MPQPIAKRVSKHTGKVTWQVRVTIGTRHDAKPEGKPVRRPVQVVRSFAHLRDAKAFLTRVRQDRAEGTAVQQSKMTLDQYLDRWLEDAVKQSVRPQTTESYRDVLGRYIRPGLGMYRLDQLTALTIQSHLKDLGERTFTRRVLDPNNKKQCKTVEYHLSPRTIRYAHSILSAALRQAVRWRILAHNPAGDVERPRQQRVEMQALSREQAVVFLKALEGTKHEALFLLALVTGMRPGEYLALKWSDLDLKRGIVTVQRTLVRLSNRWVFGEPKTSRSRRVIPIPASAVEALRRHQARQREQQMKVRPQWEDLGLVFTNEIGAPLERANLLHRHLRPLLKSAGLPDKLRLYDLRHSAATLLLTAGIHPKVASERLGHASITMTLDTYSHVLPDMQREASDKMEDLLSGGGR